MSAFINPKLKTRLESAFNDRVKAVTDRSFPGTGNNPDTVIFNVLTDGKSIVVLDFAEFGYRDPYYDASLFGASIGRLAINPLLNSRRIAQLQDAFLNEFRTVLFSNRTYGTSSSW